MVDWFRAIGDRFGILAIVVLASITRLWNLASPAKLVFDETYYVKDSFTLWKAGHELQWTKGNENTFTPDGVLSPPEFVVHSPLGKWIIGLGMQIFGAANPFGWRIMVALFGITAVWLIYLVALQLFGSQRWALLPAFLLAIDGQSIVISRTAILDGLVMTTVLLSFYLLLRALKAPNARNWIIAMTLVLGAGAAIKWTSAFFLAIFFAYYLWQTKRFKQTLLAPLALIPYLLSWTGWFVSQGWGYNAKDPLGSFIAYHQQMYHFHATLSMQHPYQTTANTWLAMLRPTSFFFENHDGTVTAINPIGNPVIWLGGIVALGFLFSWFVRNRDATSVLVFTGYIAGYLPWLMYFNRTAFQFYSITFEPWILLVITLMAYRYRARRFVVVASSIAFGIFLFFIPIYLGLPIPLWFWQAHMWIPSWI
jgi:dolichyl-phosphate-mannose--protein O-mannosyl transferase